MVKKNIARIIDVCYIIDIRDILDIKNIIKGDCKMKSIKGKISTGLALLATLFVAGTIGVKEAAAAEEAATPISSTIWIARTVDQVKADLDKMTDDTYTIVRGDTLSVLGDATGIPFVEIAERNGIVDPDWIYEGDKLVFDRDGNTVTIQSPTGETKAQISQDPKTGNGTISNGAGSNSTNSGNGSGNSTTNPPVNDGNGSGSDNSTVTPPAGGDNGQTTPDRVINKVVIGENELFTRYRVGPFVNEDEASNWVRENFPNGVKGYEIHPDGDYIYIEIEVGKGDNGADGDNGTGGEETTPPGGGDNGSGDGDNGSGGEEDVDNIPVNIGNSGIFAATQEEANAQAYALWAEDKFVEFTRFLINPALNAKGDIIGWTVVFYN